MGYIQIDVYRNLEKKNLLVNKHVISIQIQKL